MTGFDRYKALREATAPDATTEARIRGLDLGLIRALLAERDQLLAASKDDSAATPLQVLRCLDSLCNVLQYSTNGAYGVETLGPLRTAIEVLSRLPKPWRLT